MNGSSARRWCARSVDIGAPPLVIAHRGASDDAPENTLLAFRAARAQGADGVELDVMRCASGEVVVFHDDDLRRLCGRPERVRELTWERLRECEIGAGGRIPQLSHVLEELGGELLVNVELKTGPDLADRLRDDGLAAEVAHLLRRHQSGAVDHVLVSSFDPVLLARFRRAAPTVPTGLLFAREQSRPLRHAWAAPFIHPCALHPDAGLVDALRVRRWRALGYALHVWTVDAPAELRWLAALGVDGVITNRPGEAKSVLQLENG